MTAKIEYKCNFCGREIITNYSERNFQGFCGIQLCGSVDSFSNDLEKNIQGPHICRICIDNINSFILRIKNETS